VWSAGLASPLATAAGAEEAAGGAEAGAEAIVVTADEARGGGRGCVAAEGVDVEAVPPEEGGGLASQAANAAQAESAVRRNMKDREGIRAVYFRAGVPKVL